MKAFKMIVMLCLTVIVNTYTFGDTITHDQLMELFEAYSRQIQKIDATFTMQRRTSSKVSISLKWDRQSYFVNASLIAGDPVNPRVKKWVRNSKFEWHSMPERAPERELDGSWIVDVDPVEDKRVPWIIDKSEFGIEWIEKAIIPYHILYKDQINAKPDNVEVVMASQEVDDDNLCHVIYESRTNGKAKYRLEYIMDLSGGMKLLSTVGTNIGFEEPKVVSRFDCNNFKKINGVWFPFDIKEKVWNAEGNLIADESLLFEKVSLNEGFSAETFTYIPPPKSRVHDNVTNITYRVGQGLDSAKYDYLDGDILNVYTIWCAGIALLLFVGLIVIFFKKKIVRREIS